MVERLAEDHTHCKQLAYGLAEYPEIEIDPQHVVTNILMFKVRKADQQYLSVAEITQFLERAREQGILMGYMGSGNIRAVTHYGIEKQDIEHALLGIKRALANLE